MPYRRRQRSQKKHAGQPKISQTFLRTKTPEKASLIQYGMVPASVSHPPTRQPLTMQLASSSKHVRDCGVNAVRSLLSQSDASNMDHTKMTQLWKALFYAFWMSDKVLIQQELAKRLSDFIKLCGDADVAMLYVECFMQCMEREWSGIDYLRMSKFQSLVRHFMHAALDFLALNEWNAERVQQFAAILRAKLTLLSSSNRGLFLHVNDIFMEELVKVNRVESDGDMAIAIAFRPSMTFDALYNLLTPFIHFYLESNRSDEQQYVIRKVFHALLQSMHFDEAEREAMLGRPGKEDLDLYGWKDKKEAAASEQLEAFMDDDDEKDGEENEEEVDWKKLPSKQLPRFHDERMTGIDPLNPVRRKKNQSHLMFDKINYDVVMPFNRTHGAQDEERMQAWHDTYADDRAQRVRDPLLLASKMKQFRDVFAYLANDEETPPKAVSKLCVLRRMFTPKTEEVHEDEEEVSYDRSAVKSAIKMADHSKLKQRKYVTEKKRKFHTMKRTMKQARMRKLKKTGLGKISPNKQFLRRAAKFIRT